VKILLWHGYLMTGSGSNIYTYNVAAAWRRQGHEVLVLCQERAAASLPIVDADGQFAPDNLSFDVEPTGAPAVEGSCTVVRPDIAGLLPVYVYDEYEGFDVKLFIDLDDEELDRYTTANVTAMATVLKSFVPDVVITGHEVMGPYIALRACEGTEHRYVAKLHGSALEYAVKKQERYVQYASEGLGGAHRVVGGSRYMLAEASSVVPGWIDHASVVNPGVDTSLFRPVETTTTVPIVGYVGKLIAAKGVHHLLLALGATTGPRFEVVIVGYGGDEAALVALHDALARGDLDAARRIIGDLGRSDAALEFLTTVDEPYLERMASISVRFPGRLDHDPLSKVLPTFNLLVVPSILAEAFGMVAAEAAACGVLPLVPNHSGISEAGAAIEEEIGAPGLLTFDKARPIEGIAAGIDRVLSLDPATRATMNERAAAVAHTRWSWDHVAESLLEAAQ
jgi:glycosyltransferase involved in cell wall biosynthesis